MKDVYDEYWDIFNLVNGFYQDPVKTTMWMEQPNTMLGGVIPSNLIASGRGYKIREYIDNTNRGLHP